MRPLVNFIWPATSSPLMACPFIGGEVGVATAVPFIVVVGVQDRARGRETFSLLAARPSAVPPGVTCHLLTGFSVRASLTSNVESCRMFGAFRPTAAVNVGLLW